MKIVWRWGYSAKSHWRGWRYCVGIARKGHVFGVGLLPTHDYEYAAEWGPPPLIDRLCFWIRGRNGWQVRVLWFAIYSGVLGDVE